LNGFSRALSNRILTVCGDLTKIQTPRASSGNTLLDYRNILPNDFYPVIILDASGRVRTTYEYWNKYRRNLVKLTTAEKSYENLTIHVWNTGGGKDSWRSKYPLLIQGVVATINSKPDDAWLVVLHKEDEGEVRSVSLIWRSS